MRCCVSLAVETPECGRAMARNDHHTRCGAHHGQIIIAKKAAVLHLRQTGTHFCKALLQVGRRSLTHTSSYGIFDLRANNAYVPTKPG
jgi:hypothetical protein